jgi:sterol desaturase/sphingolipid hydroxylase (fatty acid hydroxylase superfamily)
MRVFPLLMNLAYIPVTFILASIFIYPIITWLNNKIPSDILGIRSNTADKPYATLLWIGYILIFDFLYYWFHRAQHQFGLMWRYHMVHHSDTNVSAVAAARHHWLEEAFRYSFITGPIILILGAGGQPPLWVGLIFIIGGMFIHWNVPLRFGFLERIIITPAYHRIHHSTQEKHFDKNFGALTQTWDNMFNTRYLPAKGEFPETGLAGITERDFWKLALPWPILSKKSGEDISDKKEAVGNLVA